MAFPTPHYRENLYSHRFLLYIQQPFPAELR